ncbi:hypothetical protein SBADM41S_05644 [Streptomyces badius]
MPWPSTASMSAGESPAFVSACRMTRCCERPLGAVRPLEAPSELMAEPRMTARTGWPLRRASDSRSRSSRPAPSDQPVPSASSENALHRPSGASPRCLLNAWKGDGVAITITPPASASEQSRFRRAWAARWSATREDEQAVSTVTAGPSSPSA